MQLIVDSHRAGASAEILVAYRFIEAGRIPSWPLVPCRYDLVVDGGGTLHRIQIKRASKGIAKGAAAYTWQCRLTTDHHSKTPLAVTAFDYLVLVTDPNRIYVIPTGGLHCAHDPAHLIKRVVIAENGERFAPYLNQFGIGPGTAPEPSQILDPTKLQRSFWHVKKSGAERKHHRRLSLSEVEAIQQLPIALYKRDQAPGLIPIEQVAQQFGVHVATLRNLLRGKRNDLKHAEEGA